MARADGRSSRTIGHSWLGLRGADRERDDLALRFSRHGARRRAHSMTALVRARTFATRFLRDPSALSALSSARARPPPPFVAAIARVMSADAAAARVPPAPMVSKLYQPAPVAGRCALVTGASSGIGFATAERLAELGCRLVVAARRKDRLDALAAKLRDEHGASPRRSRRPSGVRNDARSLDRTLARSLALPRTPLTSDASSLHTTPPRAPSTGASVHCIELDVCDVDAVMALPEALPADFADVSILVNNAGGALGTAKCTENDMNDMSTMIDANVKGLIACTRAFTPGMVARGEGHVINISSIAGIEVCSPYTGPHTTALAW